jgi:uncharacterized protein
MPVISTSSAVYLDTSALLKCYVTEINSDEVEVFLTGRFLENNANLVISTLSKLEWQCAMLRRERALEITSEHKRLAQAAFTNQLYIAYYHVVEVENTHYDQALKLIETVTPALRSLDALHLAVARSASVHEIVTADKVMALAAKELGFIVHQF